MTKKISMMMKERKLNLKIFDNWLHFFVILKLNSAYILFIIRIILISFILVELNLILIIYF